MFNMFFAKETRVFIWFLGLYTGDAESSSKQLKLAVQTHCKWYCMITIHYTMFKVYCTQVSPVFV